MQPVLVRSRKYDGSLRDEYEAFLYAEDAESYLLFVPPGTRSLDHRRQAWLIAPDGLLERYFKARWYAIWYICEQHSARNTLYIHVACPAALRGAELEWIDLDLDYRIHLDGRIERLDDDEYQAHRETMRYPAHVDAAVQAACAEIERLCAPQRWPFEHAAHVQLYRQIARPLT